MPSRQRAKRHVSGKSSDRSDVHRFLKRPARWYGIQRSACIGLGGLVVKGIASGMDWGAVEKPTAYRSTLRRML